MSACKTLIRTSLSLTVDFNLRSNQRKITSTYYQHFPSFSIFTSPRYPCFFWRNSEIGKIRRVSLRFYSQVEGAVSLENADFMAENVEKPILEPHDDISKDTVEKILLKKDDVACLMKMERVSEGVVSLGEKRWFPYLDSFKTEGTYLSSGEILQAIDPLIMEVRKERFRSVVANRTYSVCLVVEGLADYGNVSATLRSADALGFQSVHVISCDSKRYRDNRHVSMGAEKWLDIELWDSTQACFDVLHSRGYRIATTHVGIEAVSIYDMDWSCPTAIVVGNENRGISEEALKLSDFHCSIPMKGMVDSFNVSVAAGILMHQAVCDRTSRLGCHGDLTPEQRQILLAEFSLRHSKSAICIAHQYGKQKAYPPMPNL